MLRWFLAIVAVPLVSVAISGALMGLEDAASRRRHDPGAYEATRQVELNYESVSLVRLLADPQRYDGRKLLVAGYVTLHFEGAAVHLDENSYMAGLRKNAVWLPPPKWLTPREKRRLEGRYAEVAGTFDAEDLGGYGFYSGTLEDVKLIKPTYMLADYLQIVLDDRRAVLRQRLTSGMNLTIAGWTALWILWLFVRRRA